MLKSKDTEFEEKKRQKSGNLSRFTSRELLLLGVILIVAAVMVLVFGFYGFKSERAKPAPYSEAYELSQSSDSTSNKALQDRAFGKKGDAASSEAEHKSF